MPYALEYTLAVLAVACFLPVASVLRKDKECWLLLVFGLLYHGAMCTMDYLRSHHIGPPVFAFASVGLRCIAGSQRFRRLAIALSLAGAAIGIAICLHWGPDYTETFTRHPLHLMAMAHDRDVDLYQTVRIAGGCALTEPSNAPVE